MLYDFEAFRRPLARSYDTNDITAVIAVRLHEMNPWVLDRLIALAGYYVPAPRVIIVDFGSQSEYGRKIEQACNVGGFELVRLDDTDVFSLAKARNAGAARASTELLFFSDIDCFGERNLFERLVNFANSMEFGSRFDDIIDLPVYHLGQEATNRFFECASLGQRSEIVGRAMAYSILSGVGEHAEYVDPHSNFFLIRRDFFDYVGGVNENFRGHGSEDFEFLLRVAMYSMRYPVPENAADDGSSPKQKGFYEPRPYRGFRRLFELMAEPAQLAGLRIAHLHHPRSKDNSGWYESNDWSRIRFSEQTEPILQRRQMLLEYDWMPRTKQALVLIKQAEHSDVFFPLRLEGYKLIVADADDPASLARAEVLVNSGAIDAVAVFNPYMRSHAQLYPLFVGARERGIRTIVFERGALPESWYYAQDMSYSDPDFVGLCPCEEDFTRAELDLADAYATRLRSGNATLEANGEYSETLERMRPLNGAFRAVCLLPLQLDDDVAVTRFNTGYLSYTDLVSSLAKVVESHPDVLFMIKDHPLSKTATSAFAPNVVRCGPLDNIHALIDLSDFVVCYNSGVGLLALVHEKPLITLGNAYYNLPGLGKRADSLADAIELGLAGRQDFMTRPVKPFLAWLLFRKYSFFRSESVLREFKARKAHGYRNMLWYQLNFERSRSALRAALDLRVPARCYATARMGVGEEISERGRHAYDWNDIPRRMVRGASGARRMGKLSKFLYAPRRFFADSEHASLRFLASTLPERELPAVRKFQKLVRSPMRFLRDARHPALRNLGRELSKYGLTHG